MKRTILLLCAASALLLSLPWLVPHTGALILIALVPLLCAERIAYGTGMKHFWLCHYGTFVLWNAITTFWVCNATVGGGLFAVFANAAQMSIVFGLFRLSKKRLEGVLPYIFLASLWIAWEFFYFSEAQISWPWLVLGNAFAGSHRLIQWYCATGVLGGSLWAWAVNLGIFGLMVALSEGSWNRWNSKARSAAFFGMVALIAGPVITSAALYRSFSEQSEGTVDVVIGQPNFDPYEKFESMTQADQTAVLLDLYETELDRCPADSSVLLLAPETFTSDIWLNTPEASPTVSSFRSFAASHPGSEIMFGASTNRFFETRSAPTVLARPCGNGWRTNHNSAILVDSCSRFDLYHKSKLVVGTELCPYPKVFVPFEKWLCKLMGVGGLMGHCEGQEEASLLNFRGDVPIGCAVCYESVYGAHCAEYVRKGAKALTVITNDAWWGNTPGYRQHFSYSVLRAIELRRDIARCGNTGLSAFINQRGDVIQCGPWWERSVMRGSINLNSARTFYSLHGDYIGRISILVCLLMLMAFFVRRFKR